MSQKSWIENVFTKRECVRIVPSSKDPHKCLPGCQICQQLVRCCCGCLVWQHAWSTLNAAMKYSEIKKGETLKEETEQWSVETHTEESSTDAYGVINFQGGSHSHKAKYVRLSYNCKPEAILQLMLKEWKMELPKLVISVHGGMQKFELDPQIKQVLSKGLIKFAVTGAWIITGGTNTGVAEHIGDVLKEQACIPSRKICTIGITPWGAIENRNDLIGRDVVAPYQTLLNPLSKLNVLNNLHSHFILVDDGTVGKYGAEVNLRRELEKTINLQRIHARIDQGVPVVALILEGGPHVILTILEYLNESPPVPVVVLEGSGGAADILAYVYKQTEEGGNLPEGAESEIISTIKKTFNFSQSEAVRLFLALMNCMKNKGLITVFHVGSDNHQDIDVAVFTALLKGMNVSASDQLALTLAWNRVDLAKEHVFICGQQWLVGSLEQAMLDALVMDRVSFVKLLIENGVSMHKFLSIPRLEELYNMKPCSTKSTLFHLLRDVKKGNPPPGYKITLIDVGLIIEYLMGGTYRCIYTKKRFRILYKNLIQKSRRKFCTNITHDCEEHKSHVTKAEKEEKIRHSQFIQTAQPCRPKMGGGTEEVRKKRSKEEIVDINNSESRLFPYPFNELLVWAVLVKRQKMALFFWQHGEESMAKALVACKLNRSMASEAKESEVIDDASEELKNYSNEFGQLAVELLEQSFRQDETMAMKLLTYELKNWSNSTCLKLAVSSRLRPFVAHSCTQMLLSDMWMGRLNMRKNSWFKVILSILVPPAILMLEYKTKAEMSHIPQSQDAHQMTMEYSESNFQTTAKDIPMESFQTGKVLNSTETNQEMENQAKIQRIPITQKFYAFYHAPIVKFWFNMVFMSEAGKITQKIKVWFSDYLNISDTIAIVTFFVGFGLRFGAIYKSSNKTDDYVFIAGRITYCLNIIFWYVRLLDFLNVNQQAGPYVLMISKMVTNMFYIVVIMAVVLISFGVPRKAILYPHEEPSWSLAADIVFRPYWMIYGEMFAYEINVCANDSVVPDLCGPGTWLTPFLQAVYVFVEYIIMVNLLIAFFNNVYRKGMRISNILWKYQRYHFIMAHHEKPVLPPPLIILNYLNSLICFTCKRRKNATSHGPKLFLIEVDQKKLHEFEEQCIEIYFHEKQHKFNSKTEVRIQVTAERVEQMCIQIKEVGDRVNSIKHSLNSLDSQIGHLQDLSALTVDALKTLTAQKASEASKVHNEITHELSISKHLGPKLVDDSYLRSAVWTKHSSENVCSLSLPQRGPKTNNAFFQTISLRDKRHSPNVQSVKDLTSSYEREQFNAPNSGASVSAFFPSANFPPGRHKNMQSAETEKSAAIKELNSSANSITNLPSSAVKYLASHPHPHQPQQKGHLESLAKHEDPRLSKAEEVKTTVPGAMKSECNQLENALPEVIVRSKYPGAVSTSLVSTEAGFGNGGYINCGFIDNEGIDIHVNDNCSRAGMYGQQSLIRSFEGSTKMKKPLRSNNQLSARSYTEYGAPCGNIHAEGESWHSQPTEELERGGRKLSSKVLKEHLKKLRLKLKATDLRGGTVEESSGEENTAHILNEPQPADNRQYVISPNVLTEYQHNAMSDNTIQLTSRYRTGSEEDVCSANSKAMLLADFLENRSSSKRNQMTPGDNMMSGITYPFKPRMDNAFYYTAVERNNLMRLSQSIPFTPVPARGEPVTVYRLEESSPSILNNSMSSWSQRGLCAKIEFLSKEEMGGGLRRAVKVACTWSEYDILKSGQLYIIKSFLPEVVNTWSSIYKEDTVLHLCLREIQQQRAAQKLLYAFNQTKPKSIPYSPRFLEVFLLYCHSAEEWFTIEECMAGKFKKYNNNCGAEINPRSVLEQSMLAFSHWTYEYTRGELLVLDLQGVGENLTDPSVIMAGEKRSYDMVFGPANLGEDAIKNFSAKHRCNSCCRKLKLPDLKRNEYTPDEEAFAHSDASVFTFPSTYPEDSIQPMHTVL
ncbi:transient receptor potential cation channel subfamily M member 7 isoform X2 [Microcaecilia unicolor]|uniref:non-specific serine/threonine protein kinase n=1 Tax=Microcaecilia unicolor TaxID=1415580 RepID=A0A6P7WQH3_9AMPH|nr:transient receptor potential cation channel subfamily M member 7-like isoform X2 [Microcaecilia unicolor]